MDRIFALLLLIGLAVGAPLARAQDATSAASTEMQQLLELTPSQVRGAFDAYVQLQEQFADSAFEDYESLSDFVKRAPDGPKFEAIIRANGFSDVDAWLPVINALEFTIGTYGEEQAKAVEDQIREVEADTEMPAEDKARMIEMLQASVPSPNNRRVLEEMLKDPAYADRLKAFMSEE